MIDSVLKGNGNSRFLKSAVPAGTSWADALAMLQAGTFPIDFNGINAEGFQQVGTPLNKANLLKDATAAQIGLPPSTTPDGMFQALGNTGELHVWRKTVVTTEPIPEQPAGYNLGSKTNFLIGTPSRSSLEPYINVTYANTVSVSNDGTVNISGDSSAISGWYPSNGDSPNYLQMRGKFIKITQFVYLDAPRTVDMDTVYYIPNDATATLPNYGSASGEFRIQMQKVTGYPYTPAIPAGTTTTYPVSTNPNAYQEGEYGKAGYTLGDVKTGTFQIGQDATTIAANRAIIKYGESVSVTDTGTASIASESELTVTSDSSQSAVNKLKGKFFRFSQLPFSSSAFSVGKIYFFPANTVFTKQSSGNWYASKYQTVTSHGKTEPEYTIEYLGKLGDKARVQVVSYVGTGTYGSDHPNSLTFDFVPKVILIYRPPKNNDDYYHICMFLFNGVNTGITLAYGAGFNNVTWNNKEVSWYSNGASENQMSVSGQKYYAAAIG